MPDEHTCARWKMKGNELQVRTPYTENWKNNQTAEWYASKKVDVYGTSG